MLDEFRSAHITWDKATSRIYSTITANESDENGRKLVVQIINGGQVEALTGTTLHLYWITRDKLHDGLDVFKAVDLNKGEFELSYTTGMLSNKGVLNANLVLVDAVGRVVSERFKITVTEGIDNDAIQSENSFSSLTQALIDISNLEQNYAPRLNDLTAQLQQTEEEVVVNAINKPTPKQFTPIKKVQAVMVLTDDDGSTHVIPKLVPISERTGVPFSISLIAKGVEMGAGVTADQAIDLQNRLGWEILSHGYESEIDYLTVTLDEVEEDLLKSMKLLRSKGLNVLNFCYPGGRNNADIRRIVSKYYNSALGTKVAKNEYPFRTYEINRLAFPQSAPNNTFAFYKSKIDEAVTNKQLLVWMLHAGQPSLDATQLGILEDIINYAKGLGVQIPTVQGALDLLGSAIDINDGQLYINADGTNNMVNTVFKNVDLLSGQDLIPINTAPNTFEILKTTVSLVSTDRTNAPNGQGGILITNRMGVSSLASQVFYASNNTIYSRVAVNQTAWGTWKQVGTNTGLKTAKISVTIPANGRVNYSVPLGVYKAGWIGNLTPDALIPNDLSFTYYTAGSSGVIVVKFVNHGSTPITLTDSDWYYTMHDMLQI